MYERGVAQLTEEILGMREHLDQLQDRLDNAHRRMWRMTHLLEYLRDTPGSQAVQERAVLDDMFTHALSTDA